MRQLAEPCSENLEWPLFHDMVDLLEDAVKGGENVVDDETKDV